MVFLASFWVFSSEVHAGILDQFDLTIVTEYIKYVADGLKERWGERPITATDVKDYIQDLFHLIPLSYDVRETLNTPFTEEEKEAFCTRIREGFSDRTTFIDRILRYGQLHVLDNLIIYGFGFLYTVYLLPSMLRPFYVILSEHTWAHRDIVRKTGRDCKQMLEIISTKLHSIPEKSNDEIIVIMKELHDAIEGTLHTDLFAVIDEYPAEIISLFDELRKIEITSQDLTQISASQAGGTTLARMFMYNFESMSVFLTAMKFPYQQWQQYMNPTIH